MGYGADRRRRRSIRLKGYDYSQAGAYFVTICTEDREWVLGEVVAGEVRPNDAGAVALAVWEDLPRHYGHVRVDAFVVMSNHVHGIIVLTDDVALGDGAGLKPAPTEPGHGVDTVGAETARMEGGAGAIGCGWRRGEGRGGFETRPYR